MKWNINKKLLIIAIILLFIFLIFKIPILGIIVGALLGFLSGTLYFGNGILSLFYGFPKALLGYLKKELTIYPVLMFLAAPLLNLLLFLLVFFFLNLISLQMSTTFVLSFLGALCWYVFGFIWEIFLPSRIRKIMKEEFEDNVKYFRIKEAQNKPPINPNDFSNSQNIFTEERELREKIRKNPNDYKAHFQLGNLLHDLKKYEEAEKEFREAIRLNPNDEKIHNDFAILLEDLGRYEEAEKEYREAIRINPNVAQIYTNFGAFLQRLKRYEEAEKELKEAIRINPNFAGAHANLGTLYLTLERHNEAEKEYKEAIKNNLKDARIYLGLGITLKILGKYSEAEKALKEVIKINPEEYPGARLNLGIIYAEKGKGDKAKKEILKARELFEKQGKTDSVRLCDEILQNL
jgi:tetratricopeptide (TPR) repeat protein